MKTAKILVDEFAIHGDDYDEFKKELEEISHTIRHQVVNSADISLLSHMGTTDSGKVDRFFKISEANKDVFQNLVAKTLEDSGIAVEGYSTSNCENLFRKANVCLEKDSLLAKGDFEDVLNEMRNDNHLMLDINGEPMFTSKSLLTTLDRFGLKGSFLTRPSLTRDMAVTAELVEQEKPITIIYRKVEGMKKVFSILSDKYKPIDQDIIIKIINDIETDGSLGKPVCKSWEINHFFTKIYFDFPEKARDIKTHYGKTDKFIPGICIMTSDTGDCSLKILGTFRVGNSLTIQDEVLHKHIGDVNIENIIARVQESIFSEFAKLPSKLCDLISIDISDTSLDLTVKENQELNVERYKEVMDHAFKQLKIVDAVGIKTKKLLIDQLVYEVCPDVYYTAYDVCTEIMRLPERISGLPSLQNLQKAVGRAPYISYVPKAITIAP